jgi:hypothetical protein
MDTKIIKTVKAWLPWSLEGNPSPSEYSLLRTLAHYCQESINEGLEEKAAEVIKVINLLYSGGSLHEKNAIENEFLEVLAKSESPASLKVHMKFFPEKMRQAYLKTILEN